MYRDNALHVPFASRALYDPVDSRQPDMATVEDFCGLQSDERGRFQRNPVHLRRNKPQIRHRPAWLVVFDLVAWLWLLAWLLVMAGWVVSQVMEVLL